MRRSHPARSRGTGLAALRLILAGLIATTVVFAPGGRGPGAADADAAWSELRFWTGCQPGPFHEPPGPDPFLPPELDSPDPPEAVDLRVDLSRPASPILGAGFNLEHALWSCEPFRTTFEGDVLRPFEPSMARVDTGLLPAAPPELSPDELNPSVYESMLRSPVYDDSWTFLRRLNAEGVKVMLGVWGGPAQFTRDKTRLGQLLPRYYDKYVEYVSTLVDFLVREQHVRVWAVTVANEPDGGDGNRITPRGFVYIAHRLAERLAPLGVGLYGPDTGSAANAMNYLPLMLADSTVSNALAFVGFHEYNATADVAWTTDYVHERRPDLPIVVTEYTSFEFGDLDDGQEASDNMGFTLDVLSTALSHYRHGADATLYWDAVDYLQPGHDAITKWGLLRGPSEGFSRRRRYYGMRQVLPYLQPGARVLPVQQDGGSDLSALAVRTTDGGLAVFLVNQGIGPIDLMLSLSTAEGADSTIGSLSLARTDEDQDDAYLGRLPVDAGELRVTLPGRSVSTLATGEPFGARAPAMMPPVAR